MLLRRSTLRMAFCSLCLVGCTLSASTPASAPPTESVAGIEAPRDPATREPRAVAATDVPTPQRPVEPAQLPVVVVPKAPFSRVRPDEVAASAGQGEPAAPRLVLQSATRNAISDDDVWMDALGGNPNPRELTAAEWDRLLAAGLSLPDEALLRRVYVFEHADQRVYRFDVEGQDGRYLLVEMADGTFWGTYDFTAFRDPPFRSEYSDIGSPWAQRVGDRLIVNHAYNGYAKESRGHNAYLDAFDRDGRLLWRSEPLVANAMQCVVIRESHAICGYGFTAEPDYLSVIDLRNGEVTSRTKLRKGPRMLAWKDGTLWVRTYDENLVFRVE